MWINWELLALGAGAPYTPEAMVVREIGVVGGGIAGTTIAYELARRGARVTLFERGSLAGEASGRNMGLLLNQTETGVVRIMQQSLDIYRRLAGGGVDFRLRQVPQLIIAADDSQYEAMGRRAFELRAVGMSVKELRSAEIRKHFKALGPRFRGGHLVGDAWALNPAPATVAFAQAARESGAVIATATSVIQVVTTGGRVQGLITDAGRIALDTVVLATGPWLPELFKPAPVSVGRGWLLRTARLDFSLPWIVEDTSWPDQDQLGLIARAPTLAEVAEGHDHPVVQAFVIAQQPDGEALIGTSLSPSLREPYEGIDMPQRIAAKALAAAPGLAATPITAAWYGLRPMTLDGMPLAGPAGPRGLWVHGGHGSMGMMTAPAIAGWLAKAILEDAEVPELADFRVGRF
jgi:D-hydroxyproline dehydrogenase subunit beta